MEVDKLLEEVKRYADTHVTGWYDYEHYKKVFHGQGIYGYESTIARLLGL